METKNQTNKFTQFFKDKFDSLKQRHSAFKELPLAEKKHWWTEFLLNNALYIFLVLAIIIVTIINPRFLSTGSIINIVNLSAASLPIALGIAGCIVLTGTDLSAGRVLGLTACISASLLQRAGVANKMFPDLGVFNIFVVILIAIAIGAIVGAINGFFVSKFNLHPFIVTLGTQLIVSGATLLYLNLGANNGQSIANLDPSYTNVVNTPLIDFGSGTILPMYVLYAALLTVIMWFIWNKTKFGKNMFAVGSNPEAAKVSGVNVGLTILGVFMLAGVMYGLTGFIDGARIASNSASTGLNAELDAIAACVIGGVSFVGGIGKIRGVIIGVILLRIIFSALNAVSIDSNLINIIKGIIILLACTIDMRKYMVKR